MSVIQNAQVNGLFASKVGGVGATIKYFPSLLGPSIGVAPSTPSAANATGALLLPGGNVLNAQLFDVLAAGSTSNTTGGDTATIVVQAVTGSFASPVYTTLASQAIVLAAGVPQSWAAKLTLYGDSTSGKVGGNFVTYKQGVASALTTSAAVLSSINFNTGNVALNGAPFGLVIGVTFTTGTDPLNTASLNQFQIVSA